jgi:acyl dehydratase
MTRAFPDSLSLQTEPISAVALALFAAAAGDHNPLHLDESVASAAGFEQPLIHGMLTMAHVGRLFTSHFGAGSVADLDTRFTGVAMRGQRLTLQAQLERLEDGEALYRITAQHDGGTPVVQGEARVLWPAKG